MEKKSQFTILLAGAVIGAIGAVLLAPRSGQKTRERLAKQTPWVGQKFGDMSKGIAEQVKKMAECEAVHNGFDNADIIGGGSSRGRTAMVIVEVLAAVAATLLVAPRSGKEARQWLVKQMRTGRYRFKEAVQKVQSHAQKETQQVRNTVKEGVQSVEDMAQHMPDTGSEIYGHAR